MVQDRLDGAFTHTDDQVITFDAPGHEGRLGIELQSLKRGSFQFDGLRRFDVEHTLQFSQQSPYGVRLIAKLEDCGGVYLHTARAELNICDISCRRMGQQESA